MSKARGASAARSARRGANMYKVRPSNVGRGKRFSRLQYVYEDYDVLGNPVVKNGKATIVKTIPHFNDQHY